MKIIIQELIKGNIKSYEDKEENIEEIGKQVANYISNGIPFSVHYAN